MDLKTMQERSKIPVRVEAIGKKLAENEKYFEIAKQRIKGA